MKCRTYPRLLGAALGLAVATAMVIPAGAAAASATVLPPQSRPFGATYGQWDARWWQWLLQTPVNINPEFSAPGTPGSPAPVDCSAGQSGKVWFLGGTFAPTTPAGAPPASNVYRTCSIPSGTFLFFPLLNDEFDNLTCHADGSPASLEPPWSAAQLKNSAATLIDDIVPGTDVGHHRRSLHIGSSRRTQHLPGAVAVVLLQLALRQRRPIFRRADRAAMQLSGRHPAAHPRGHRRRHLPNAGTAQPRCAPDPLRRRVRLPRR